MMEYLILILTLASHSVFICSGCGDSIFDGDKYVELMGEQWCMDCIEECIREAEYDPY